MPRHLPVMLTETVASLNIKPSGTYVDLTLGLGGHARAILKRLTTGMLFAFDKDLSAVQASRKKLAKVSNNFQLFHLDYRYFKSELARRGVTKVDGIVADLGVSAPQVDNPERGFSYNATGFLDMRMDQGQSLNAYQVVNSYSEKKLVDIFRYFADVKLPQRVAKGIIANRPIATTLELVAVIKKSLPAPVIRQKNPAKAVFQAIRIAVNDELKALKWLLQEAISLLNPSGALAIITFHSLEDRLVKRAFNDLTKDPTGQMPVVFKKKYGTQKIRPSGVEIQQNKRARSATLRVLVHL